MQSSESCGECAIFHRRQTGLYIHTAFMALTVYDHLNTLPLEIKYVWPSTLNLVTILYYTMKYGIIFDVIVLGFRNLSPATLLNQCRFTLPIYLFIGQVCLWAGEALLGLRIWALWDRDPRLTFGLPIVHSTLTAISLLNVAMLLKSVDYAEIPFPHMTGCFVTDFDGSLRDAAICMLVWITLMLILLLIPGYRAYRAGRNSHFVRMILQDGMLYYIYLLALHVVNLTLMVTEPLLLAGVPIFPVFFLHIALTSRIFLHTRRQANRQIVVLNHSNGEEMWDSTSSI